MSFWKRKAERVPDWAEGMGADGLRNFYEVVSTELKRRGVSYQLGDGVAVVGEPPETLGLMNLAQVCQRVERNQWPSTISAHLESVLDTPDVDALAEDYEKVRTQIKVRLFSPEYVPESLSRPVADGVAAVLVYDLPQTIATMGADHPARLGKSQDELFEVAYLNVRQQDRPRVQEVEIGPAGNLLVLEGESFFTATHVLWIEEYFDVASQQGFLVSVPHRHIVIAYPMRDLRTVQALNSLIPITRKQYSQGPGSISPELYWSRKGSLLRLPYRLARDRIELIPPDEFVEALNALPPG